MPELTDLSLPRIGTLFGGRDHTTVLHGVNTVHRLIQTDKALFDSVTALLQKSEGNVTHLFPSSPRRLLPCR